MEQISLNTLLELLLGLAVGIMFASAVPLFTDQSQLQDYALSKDVALLVDTMHALPYNVYYEYPERSYGTTLSVTGKDVIVTSGITPSTSLNKLVLSQYGYTPSKLYDRTTPYSMIGSAIAFNKTGLHIIKLNDSYAQRLSPQEDTNSFIVQTSKDDLTIDVVVSPSIPRSQQQVFETLQHSLTLRFASKGFHVSTTNPYLTIVLDSKDDNLIHYSTTNDPKLFARYLQLNLINGVESAADFKLISGTVYDVPEQSIELVFSQDAITTIEQSQLTQLYAILVVNSFEQVYEE